MLTPVASWHESAGFPLLASLALVPFAGMLAVWRGRSLVWARNLSLATGISSLLLTALLVAFFDHNKPGVQFFEQFSFLGLSYSAGVDGLNILFLALTSITGFLVLIYLLVTPNAANRRYLAAVLGYQSILTAAFSALNLLQFWFVSVLELFPIVFLISQAGWCPRKRFLLIRLVQYFGSSLLIVLAGFLLLAFGLVDSEHELTFDLLTLMNNNAYLHDETLIFILLFYGFAIRMPLFPFHGWLPVLAEQQGLASLTIFIVGLKLGIYAMVRFIFPLVPGIAEQWSGFALTLCLISIFYGALLAFMQNNVYRLLAFAIISHTGILGLGVFSFNESGLEGALLLCLVYGLASAGMLFSVSFLYERTHTAMLPRLGNLFDAHTGLGLLFLITALSTMIMPGSLGFDAGHVLLEGIIEEHEWLVAVTILVGNVLAAGFLLWTFQRIFLAKSKRGARFFSGNHSRFAAGLIVLIICALHIGTGLNSLPLLKLIDQEVKELVSQYPMHSAEQQGEERPAEDIFDNSPSAQPNEGTEQ